MAVQKKHSRGTQPLVTVRSRAASREEAQRADKAIDGLLAELVRQELALGRKQNDSEKSESQ